MLSIMKKVTENVVKHEPVNSIDNNLIKDARKKFVHYQKRGTILSDWDEMKWKVTDQKSIYTIVFSRKEFELRKVCKEYKAFITDLKTFFMLRFGTCTVEAARSMVSYIIDQIIKSRYFTIYIKPSGKMNGFPLAYYIELLYILPDVPQEYIRLCEQTLTEIRNRNAEQRRQKHPVLLSEFQSYYRFDWILRDYWNNVSSQEEKAVFWPLYLYWIITTILPLRVTEFCLTAYDCIKEEAGRFYLTVRRSRLKGTGIKIHSYTIEGDYIESTYEIPQWVYESIQMYKTLTVAYVHPLGLLFSIHFLTITESRKQKMVRPDRIFNNSDMDYLLKKFYSDVIDGYYKKSIITQTDLEKRYVDSNDGSMEMEENEIMPILLKHTRHIAMINLIMRGCNPMVIKEFAGHADAAISENYYGNTSGIVRCATKYIYDRARNKNSDAVVFHTGINAAAFLPDKPVVTIKVDCGECCSEKFISGDASDCLVYGGDCLHCQYLREKKVDDDISLQEQKVDAEVAYIMELLRDPDLEQKIEEYQKEMLRTQQSIALLYRKYYIMEEKKNAEKKEV